MSTLKKLEDVKSIPLNVGIQPSRAYWPDDQRADEKFLNCKAELWWICRERLLRAYEYYLYLTDSGGQMYPLEDILLLPDDNELCSQLSLPKAFKNEKGKIFIERKDQLSSRGVKSPDEAEALILTFYTPSNTITTETFLA
jgi:hypothetical protein